MAVRPVQHGKVFVVSVTGDSPVANDIDHGNGFFHFVRRFHQRNAFAFEVLRPQPLVRPPPVVADDMVGGIENSPRRAIVLFQLDNGRVGEVALKVQDNLDIRAPERINRVMNNNPARDIIAEVGNRQVVGLARVFLIGDGRDLAGCDADVVRSVGMSSYAVGH